MAFIYLFLPALVLHCCTWAFSSCSEWGLLFIEVHRLLTAMASLVVEHRLYVLRLSSCGTQASLLCNMWNLCGPRMEPMSPSLVGEFLTTGPTGNSTHGFYIHHII